MASELDPNHEYLANEAQRLGGTVLDFGCGKGHVVALLRERGVEAYGADVFWGGMSWDEGPHRQLLDDGWIREIKDGRLPFDDDTFDTIVSDQVFEHVENFDQSVAEMVRVLKPTGRMYHQFPPRDIFLEPHTKVPLAHRLPIGVRRRWLRAAKTVGIGRHPLHIDDRREWANWGAAWIDDYCSYRPRKLIEGEFRSHGFEVRHREAENCAFRARERPVIGMAVERLPRLAAWSFRALGCDCIELSRPVR
jgi:SAM-dependent methyltransferase